MWAYFLRRLLSLIPVLLGITLVVFCFLHLIPGDPVVAMLGERATPDQIAATRQQLGLDQPLSLQYLTFLSRLLRLDLGHSLISGIPVIEDLKGRWPATFELTIVTLLLALCLGIPMGILAAVFQHRWPDRLTLVGSLLGASFPVYWLGLLLIYLFAIYLQWLPPSGRLSTDLGLRFQPITGFYLVDAVLKRDLSLLLDTLAHLVLPALTLGTVPLAVLARMTRTALLDTLSQTYISTARAKGLPEVLVILRHGLKNALLPIVTVIGLQFGTLLGGAILTETIFAWPGIGSWLYDGILARDYPVVLNGVVIVSTTFVMINIAVDLTYAWIDPRIQQQ
ncbi:peptide ABC transporter permease [Leptolyngbya sp. 'hensonii']|uniref:ABC transporter permease n=1 Tax=Leptolyngbya sp. 'hensonii' TaxID=1922337 RepID=UPI00094FACAD|nr:ABC transporter permease [Leptolyngbya sp. 'hensonii']OLP16588.1 peptide ABC transporter permease [Leptolyngbya sp. 'hensonii']